MPGHSVVDSNAGVDAVIVTLSTLDACRARRVVRSLEVGRMRDHFGREHSEFFGGTFFRLNIAFLVEEVPDVDHVHGVSLRSPL